MFSILILTIFGREEQFKKLNSKLHEQILDNNLQGEVEIITYKDDCLVSVGTKRTALVNAARGKFVAFIDDDDDVSPKYVELIHKAITNNPDIDCIGFRGLLVAPSGPERPFEHSIIHRHYHEDLNMYYRPPNHLNPIRQNIAIKYPFDEINLGEDTDFAMRLVKDNVLKKEVFIDGEIMYYYQFNPHQTATQRR
jgi:glycosyltransferase involved in cell wall biosynthesis